MQHLSEPGDLILGIAENLRHFANGAATAIANQSRREPRAITSILFVDVLNNLFAAFMLEVDIDVRRLATFFGDEAVKQQLVFSRINRRYFKAIANRGIRGRAAPLAANWFAECTILVHTGTRKPNNVGNSEKVRRILHASDDLEFAVQRRHHLLGDSVWVAFASPFPRKMDKSC